MYDTQEAAPHDGPAPAGREPDRAPGCEGCGALMATDQRYCLHCGARRGEPRLPIDEVLAQRSDRAEHAATATAPAAARDWTPIAALGGLALLAIMLVVGVLIGKTGGTTSTAGAPQVIKLAGGGPAAAGTAADVSARTFKSDWPAGKHGFTVEIGELPKTTPAASVAQAKSDAASKGAPKVGALASDDFASLPGGKYIIYSGVYGTRAAASRALKGLRSKFPQAKVVEVSGTAGKASGPSSFAGKKKATLSRKDLNNLNQLNGSDYEKQSRKLPTTTVLPGKPPAKDNKAPGAGDSGTVIK